MPRPTTGEIADFLGGKYEGDRSVVIEGVRPIAEAGARDLTFLSNPKYASLLDQTKAAAILVKNDLAGGASRWIRVVDPYLALARVLERWFAEIPRPEGLSPEARIDPTAQLGREVRIGAGVTIGAGCRIGDRVTIFEGSYIGPESTLGEGTTIHPNVTIYYRSQIGRRCIVHAGAVIGSDGYGFATSGGKHHKIPQIGLVRIEDDVEIGAGTTIDRAALGETVIGEGTKIDNLVQIGHNVKIGKHCLIVAQVGVAGSTEIGDGCVLGGQAGVGGHLEIGARVQVAAQSAVMKSFDGPATISGTPARPAGEHLKTQALVQKLPELFERLKALEDAGEGD